MARFPDGANAEDLGLLHPGDDEFLQELLGSETPSLVRLPVDTPLPHPPLDAMHTTADATHSNYVVR